MRSVPEIPEPIRSDSLEADKRNLLQKSTTSGKTYKAEALRKSKDFTL